ncbi:MFS transporter [Stratiformator vulcanicus]|uniref:Major Facilitator Superfamily protein n=1 Tax=Stratiformator vulcanicus TaxID=2527980 RepID=A0A517R6L8_9PLAN|nr:MFS transporter [Stratiformator vulcanicus]QDT39547.1 Major Facilitator Superfamily protein [Stratiformator vulcanicus]
MATYQVLLRLAWVFKTETVFIPAFLQSIAGPAWVQGCLPVLNRLGQSVPPILASDSIRDTPKKKWLLLVTTAGMGLCFAVICGLIALRDQPWVAVAAAPLFLSAYCLFFAMTGLNQVVFGTLQGKLIRADRRGRLLGIAGVVGSVLSVTAIFLVLGGWSGDEASDFLLPFGITAFGMFVAATIAIALAEPADDNSNHPAKRFSFGPVFEVLRGDRNFRVLAVCAMLFMAAYSLFPHYVTLVRQSEGASGRDLIYFVVSQNIGVGLFSVVIGRIGDRLGNRMAVRSSVLINSTVPALALLTFEFGSSIWFMIPYFVLGMMPVTFRALTNYTLELTAVENHARYISTLRLCLAVPIVTAIPIGILVGWLGHLPVFLGGTVLILLAFAGTFLLDEPRFRATAAGGTD